MAELKKISLLAELETLADGDYFMIDDASEILVLNRSKKIAAAGLLNYIGGLSVPDHWEGGFFGFSWFRANGTRVETVFTEGNPYSESGLLGGPSWWPVNLNDYGEINILLQEGNYEMVAIINKALTCGIWTVQIDGVSGDSADCRASPTQYDQIVTLDCSCEYSGLHQIRFRATGTSGSGYAFAGSFCALRKVD